MLDKIKRICREKGIPIYKMEEDLGLASGYVSKLSRSSPNLKNAVKIADYLGVTICELMNRECCITNTLRNREKTQSEVLISAEWVENLENRFKHLVSMLGAVDITVMKEIVGISEMIEEIQARSEKGEE